MIPHPARRPIEERLLAAMKLVGAFYKSSYGKACHGWQTAILLAKPGGRA